MSKSCKNCWFNGDISAIMKCGKCRHADYCSKDCQKKHWSKHKPNCVKSDHSIHALFDLCSKDLLPNSGSKVAMDYGFDSVRVHHADVLWESCSAEQILLGLWQMIKRDVRCLETPGESQYVFNSIGASMKMIVKAMENNKLDEFLHLYIKNIFSLQGANSGYCKAWIWNRMVIGPTQTEGMTRDQIQQMRREIYHKYYGNTEPENCCCAILEKNPVVPFPF